METENSGLLLQEILEKLEKLDTRLAIVESQSQEQNSREMLVNEGKREMEDRYERRADYHADRLTRQTKIEFLMFDGNRVQDSVFKSERFFELDDTSSALKVSISSVYLSS